MSKVPSEVLDKNLNSVPAMLSMQFEIPRLKKMIKVNMNTKSTIKQHLPIFSTKFDTDFTSFRVTPRLKLGKEKREVPIDIPIRYIIANVPSTEQLIAIELAIAYEGGWCELAALIMSYCMGRGNRIIVGWEWPVFAEFHCIICYYSYFEHSWNLAGLNSYDFSSLALPTIGLRFGAASPPAFALRCLRPAAALH